jgi:lipoprotein-releasing system permease protein
MAAVAGAIASRFLKRAEPWRNVVHLITLGIAAVWLGCAFGFAWFQQPHVRMSASWLPTALFWTSAGAGLLFLLVGYFLAVAQRLTVFPSISTFGLYLGSAALVATLSIMSGFEQDLQRKILGANAHIVITTPERPLTAWRDVEKKVRAAVDGKVTPYISSELMVASSSNLSGVLLRGVDPASAADVTDLARNMEQGSLDHLAHPEKIRALGGPPGLWGDDDGKDPDAPKEKDLDKPGTITVGPARRTIERKVLPGILVGRELAKNLRLYLGDDVNVISPQGDIGPTGMMPRSRPFRVAGIFFSGMYEYDTKHIYMSIEAAQKFLSLEDEVTGFEVRIADPDATGPALDRLRAALGPGYEVSDWKELNRSLFSALKIEKVMMFAVLCCIILVTGFSIVANGIMLVRQKRREIAMLKAMGATDGTLMTVFLSMGLRIGLLGVGCGVALGILVCAAIARFGVLESDVYYISRIPVRMNPVEIALVLGASMAIALAAMIYPAYAAARMRPVEGLRYDQA